MANKDEIADLRHQIERKDDRISELEEDAERLREDIKVLKEQLEESADLHTGLVESAQDYEDCLENFCETFGLVQSEDGKWSNGEAIKGRQHLIKAYTQLHKGYNKLVNDYNKYAVPNRPCLGRPLSASPTQQDNVFARRTVGESLRDIALATGLGVRTVRTIIDKKDGVDRATLARLERRSPEKAAEAKQLAMQLRRIKALPKRVNAYLDRSKSLRSTAKGLGDKL